MADSVSLWFNLEVYLRRASPIGVRLEWTSLAASIFDRLLFKATIGALISLIMCPKVFGRLFMGSEFSMLKFLQIGTHVLNLGFILFYRLGKLSHRTWLNFNDLLLRFPRSFTGTLRSV